MVDMMLKEVNVTSQQVTYYLEEICLQTKIGQIERSFVTDIVKRYCGLVDEGVKIKGSSKSKKGINGK